MKGWLPGPREFLRRRGAGQQAQRAGRDEPKFAGTVLHVRLASWNHGKRAGGAPVPEGIGDIRNSGERAAPAIEPANEINPCELLGCSARMKRHQRIVCPRRSPLDERIKRALGEFNLA